MKYAIETFGCKVNQYESSAAENAMRSEGFEPCGPDGGSEADIVIINSCAVTENSAKKALHAVRAAKKRGALVLLCGCFPQAFPDEAAESGADIIAGTGRRGDIPKLIKEYLKNRGFAGEAPLSVPPTDAQYEELGFPDFGKNSDKTRAFIKIEDGCDRYCSYCIIPYARGRVRSRDLAEIKEEARRCAQLGHREIVLVGINLSRFGSDTGCDLADAVSAVSEPEEIARVRLSSLEPELMTDELIQKLAGCRKLCPHFHLSLQSGCGRTLARMNRRYTAEEYADIVKRLREAFPGCALTTDIMVGFAGETEEEFAESLDFAEKIGFARMHVFTYSVRKGTAAEKLPGHVDEQVKLSRYSRMSQLAQRLRQQYLEGLAGRVVPVLVQKRTSEDYAQGLAPDYTPVRVYGSRAERHEIINVRITGVQDDICTGEEV